jgi:hypothetical protein
MKRTKMNFITKTMKMTQIKEFLFGRRTSKIESFKPGYHTVHPPQRIDKYKWMKEFKVGMLHDRKAIHLN